MECCSDDLDGDAKETQYSFCFSRRYLCFVMIAQMGCLWILSTGDKFSLR